MTLTHVIAWLLAIFLGALLLASLLATVSVWRQSRDLDTSEADAFASFSDAMNRSGRLHVVRDDEDEVA